MNLALRFAAFREQVAESVWLPISVAAAVGVLLGALLGRVPAVSALRLLSVEGDVQAVLVTALLGAFVTVTGVLLSIVVVALQIALQQFSPRLLDTVLRDRRLQWPLAVLLGVVSYLIALLQALRADRDQPPAGVAVALLATLAALGAVVFFVSHVTRGIRVEALMHAVATRTRAAIEVLHPEPWTGDEPRLAAPADAHVVASPTSGYLQNLDIDALLGVATGHGVSIRFARGLGSFVVEGTPLAQWWPARSADAVAVAEEVAAAVHFGYERTMQQTPIAGLGQLLDMAVRALSPAVNDPRTTIESVHHLSALLACLAPRACDWVTGRDADGDIRFVVPRPDFAELLDLCFGQIRRFGAHEPSILVALLAGVEAIAVRSPAPRRELLLAEAIRISAGSTVALADDAARVEAKAAAVIANLRLQASEDTIS